MTDIAVKVSGATISFGTFAAVMDVSFDVGAGQCFALVGGSGSGKTTLMRAILGLQPLTAGHIGVAGLPVDGTTAGFRRRARLIQPVFQDAVSSLSPRMRIASLFLEAGRLAGLKQNEALEKMRGLFDRLGLPETVAFRYSHQISGGQARRVAICRALMMSPRILVADEPTAGLDLSAQGEMMNLLQDLRQKQSITIVMVTHNLAVARLVADQTGVLCKGRLVELGPTERVFTQPESSYARNLIGALS